MQEEREYQERKVTLRKLKFAQKNKMKGKRKGKNKITWKSYLDENTGRYYYFHKFTNETLWEEEFDDFRHQRGALAEGLLMSNGELLFWTEGSAELRPKDEKEKKRKRLAKEQARLRAEKKAEEADPHNVFRKFRALQIKKERKHHRAHARTDRELLGK